MTLRHPEDAELHVSNAIAEITEAMAVLYQYAPKSGSVQVKRKWSAQIARLERAGETCAKVRIALTTWNAFAALREKP